MPVKKNQDQNIFKVINLTFDFSKLILFCVSLVTEKIDRVIAITECYYRFPHRLIKSLRQLAAILGSFTACKTASFCKTDVYSNS